MHGSADDDYRVVIDEDGLNWNGRDDAELSRIIDRFSELLQPLADGRQVAVMTAAYAVECWESVSLLEISFTDDRRVPRDARLRLAKLFDKCRTIEPLDDDIPQLILMHDIWREPSWGLAHALTRAAEGRAMSCLIGPVSVISPGWTTVERESGQAKIDIHLLSDSNQIPQFWRGVLIRESACESSFFALTDRAFPRLIFSDTLTFGRFKGSHNVVLPWLVRLLSAVDDHFADAMIRHHGDQHRVMKEFSARGVEISPESSQTHKNSSAWATRLVTYEGIEYRCEWHGKRLWNTDRVHFSLPISEYQNRVLIGIFTDHLP